MITLRQFLQSLVLNVNRLPYGLKLTRLPYRLALHAVIRLVGRYPTVKAVYARNSYALGTWVPGRSDIDLTLILDARSSPDEEMRTVQGFRKGYAALVRRFPMLGEFEVINEAHLDAWTRYSITGYEARFWLPLYGSHPVRTLHHGEAEQLKLDRLNHALSIYMHQMSPVLWSAPRPVLKRYVIKIMGYLDSPVEVGTDGALGTMSRNGIQTLVLHELGARVSCEYPAEGGHTLDLDRILGRKLIPEVENGPSERLNSLLETSAGTISAVLTSRFSQGNVYCLLADDLDPGRMTEGIVAACEAGLDASKIMPLKLFTHYLHYLDPLEYLGLVQQRTLLAGTDPLAEPNPYPADRFDRAIREASVYILNFPYNPSLEEVRESEFDGLLLGWVARLARYFEDGIIDFEYESLLNYWKIKTPPVGIAEWQAKPDETLARFKLVRMMADAVCAGLEAN
ncbi:hypothetical protein ACFL1S_03265 [Pseudomonadota bacterium]